MTTRICWYGRRRPIDPARRFPSAGCFLRMADVDEVGTIAISGPNVFAGYLDPQQNADLRIDIEGTRWLNTGDLTTDHPPSPVLPSYFAARAGVAVAPGNTS
jgi:acyl-CoA synthetase (AMP-forming)/AMP-acid ligase II